MERRSRGWGAILGPDDSNKLLRMNLRVRGRDGAVQPLRAVLVHALQTHVYIEPMRHSLKMHHGASGNLGARGPFLQLLHRSAHSSAMLRQFSDAQGACRAVQGAPMVHS